MKKININNELTLSYNERSNIMTAGELKNVLRHRRQSLGHYGQGKSLPVHRLLDITYKLRIFGIGLMLQDYICYKVICCRLVALL